MGSSLGKIVDYGTPVGWAGGLYSESQGKGWTGDNPVGNAVDQINPFNQPSTAGVTGAANDAKTLQNTFLGQYNSLQPGQAPTMSAAQMGAGQAAAAMGRVAPNVSAAQMNAANLNTANADQDRAMQLGLAGSLAGTISGQTPSVAQQQQANAFSQLAAQQAGLAAAAGRGGNQALAARTAMQQQGQLGAQAANQAALLRANEIATAQGQLGQLGGQMAGQDIGIAQANQNAQLQAGATNAQLSQQANLQNQANAQTVNLANQQSQQQTNLANLQAQMTAAQTNVANQQQANANNQSSQIQTRGQDITQQQNLGQLANTANQNQITGQNDALTALTAQKANQNNMISGALGSAATMSDRRLKENLAPADSSAVDAMLSSIKPVTYRYKQAPESAGGKFGVVAQDVEKTPLGAAMVRNTPQGKAIDIPSATGALLASVARLGERVAAVEGKKPDVDVKKPQATKAGRRAA